MAEFELGEFYDQMIDWDKRLAREGPFFQKLFAQYGVRRVLDCGCGTGRHAQMFAQWGLEVTACDIDERMLAQTQARCGSAVRLVQSSFADLGRHFEAAFDAVVCVGNSLAAVTDDAELERSLKGIRAALHPAGVGVVQVLNLQGHPNHGMHFSPAREVEHQGRRGVLVRWRYRHDDHLMTALVFLEQTASGWQVHPRNRGLRPFTAEDLTGRLRQAGLTVERLYGTYALEPLEPDKHLDLIAVIRRPA